jgi:hypothetical protein
LLILAMFFQELVEQHRVHGVVTDGEKFTVLVAHYQIGTYLCYFFRDQTKLRCIGVVGLVVEGDWLERKDGFADVAHRLDVVFESARGASGRAELASRMDQYLRRVGGDDSIANVA